MVKSFELKRRNSYVSICISKGFVITYDYIYIRMYMLRDDESLRYSRVKLHVVPDLCDFLLPRTSWGSKNISHLVAHSVTWDSPATIIILIRLPFLHVFLTDLILSLNISFRVIKNDLHFFTLSALQESVFKCTQIFVSLIYYNFFEYN